mmetsp:Transcript_133416/g.386196  ORF Transcript_133416/g.386196 Transcript_133416/m.386196 type:complete len:334 (+) Transcript_133416:607-1608(+)
MPTAPRRQALHGPLMPVHDVGRGVTTPRRRRAAHVRRRGLIHVGVVRRGRRPHTIPMRHVVRGDGPCRRILRWAAPEHRPASAPSAAVLVECARRRRRRVVVLPIVLHSLEVFGTEIRPCGRLKDGIVPRLFLALLLLFLRRRRRRRHRLLVQGLHVEDCPEAGAEGSSCGPALHDDLLRRGEGRPLLPAARTAEVAWAARQGRLGEFRTNLLAVRRPLIARDRIRVVVHLLLIRVLAAPGACRGRRRADVAAVRGGAGVKVALRLFVADVNECVLHDDAGLHAPAGTRCPAAHWALAPAVGRRRRLLLLGRPHLYKSWAERGVWVRLRPPHA